MGHAAVLVLWLALDVRMPPTAAFIRHFDTYKECMDFKRSIVQKGTRDRTSCLLLVVDPKEGIKE